MIKSLQRYDNFSPGISDSTDTLLYHGSILLSFMNAKDVILKYFILMPNIVSMRTILELNNCTYRHSMYRIRTSNELIESFDIESEKLSPAIFMSFMSSILLKILHLLPQLIIEAPGMICRHRYSIACILRRSSVERRSVCGLKQYNAPRHCPTNFQHIPRLIVATL